MVHHQIHRHQRLDDFRIFAQPRHGGAHGRQIHQQWHTGEILQHDARHNERDFLRPFRARLPVGQRADIVFGDLFAVAIAQDGFEHEPEGDGQPGNRADAGLFERRQGIKSPRPAVAGFKRLQGG